MTIWLHALLAFGVLANVAWIITLVWLFCALALASFFP